MNTYQRYKHKAKEYQKNRTRNKNLIVRVSEKEKEEITKALEYYNLSFNGYMFKMCNQLVEQYKNEVNGGKE